MTKKPRELPAGYKSKYHGLDPVPPLKLTPEIENRIEAFLKKHPLWKTDPVLKDALERAEKIIADEKNET